MGSVPNASDNYEKQKQADTRKELREVATQLKRRSDYKATIEISRLPKPMRFAIENLHLIGDPMDSNTWLIKPEDAPNAPSWNMLILSKKNQAKFLDIVTKEMLSVRKKHQEYLAELKMVRAKEAEAKKKAEREKTKNNPTLKQIDDMMDKIRHAQPRRSKRAVQPTSMGRKKAGTQGGTDRQGTREPAKRED